jgi:hypothetical protein
MQRVYATFQLVGTAVLAACALSAGSVRAFGQTEPLMLTGQVSVAGRETPYRIRSLPVSSFPDLPHTIAETLLAQGCVIPQTYEAKRPENVIHGNLERPGSSDWAVLCATNGRVSLLVFFASASPEKPTVLAAAAETDRLRAHGATGELGFDWGIDAAGPKRVHDAQAGMAHRPPPPDHDCLADTTLDRQTVYHFYEHGDWKNIEVAQLD